MNRTLYLFPESLWTSWLTLAKRLGIKPGSKEYHSLNQDLYGQACTGKDKGKI